MAQTIREPGVVGARGAAAHHTLGWLAVILGPLSMLLAVWPSAHLLGSLAGVVSILAGGVAQLFSDTRNERSESVIGAVAGGAGLMLNLAHGGFGV